MRSETTRQLTCSEDLKYDLSFESRTESPFVRVFALVVVALTRLDAGFRKQLQGDRRERIFALIDDFFEP